MKKDNNNNKKVKEKSVCQWTLIVFKNLEAAFLSQFIKMVDSFSLTKSIKDREIWNKRKKEECEKKCNGISCKNNLKRNILPIFIANGKMTMNNLLPNRKTIRQLLITF